jgi:predicted RNase H-like HicB family nuclease
MSVKSKSSATKSVARKAKGKRPDRAFDSVAWSEAGRLVLQYQVILHCEDDHWYGRGLEFPKVFADGETADECVAETRKAMQGVVAFLIESGKSPPAPAREGARHQQVNVRLTSEERLLFESAARRKGFAGLSDFFRSAATNEAAK